MRDRGWRTRDFIALSRIELGIFFHARLGPAWQQLVAKRTGHTVSAVRFVWPRDNVFQPRPRCPYSPVFQDVEDLARSYGFRSTLENPAMRACRAATRYYRAVVQKTPEKLP